MSERARGIYSQELRTKLLDYALNEYGKSEHDALSFSSTVIGHILRGLDRRGMVEILEGEDTLFASEITPEGVEEIKSWNSESDVRQSGVEYVGEKSFMAIRASLDSLLE